MQKNEKTALLAKLTGQWPRWEPTPLELEAWESLFDPLDALNAQKALNRHFASSRYNSPVPGEFSRFYQEAMDTKRKYASDERPAWMDYIDTGLVTAGKSALTGRWIVYRVLLGKDDPRRLSEVGWWEAAESNCACQESIFKTPFKSYKADSQEYREAMAEPIKKLELLEDQLDLDEVKKRLTDGKKPLSYKVVRQKLGLGETVKYPEPIGAILKESFPVFTEQEIPEPPF